MSFPPGLRTGSTPTTGVPRLPETGWARLRRVVGRLTTLKVMAGMAVGLFIGGFVSARAVDGYASKTYVTEQVSAVKTPEAVLSRLDVVERRIDKLEVNLSTNVEWIKDSLRSIAARNAVRLDPPPPPIAP